jgi:transcriptional regulator with XRE-family HTH domain
MLNIRLKNLRNEKKLTQGDVANKLNIALTTYANYEQGTRNPDWNMLLRLSDIFDCSVDYMIGRTNNRKEVLIPPNEGEILLTKAKNANVSIHELEAYIEARKKAQNIND